MYTQEDMWLLMKAFFQEKGLVRQHLDSYNEFVEKDLQQIIDSMGGVEIPTSSGNLYIKFGEISIGEPRVTEFDGSSHSVTPLECRLRNLTYAAPLFLEMTPIFNGKTMTTDTVYIGDLPVMLKSEICPLSKMSRKELLEIGEDPDDPGGYFIINGSERLIIGLEDLAPNRVIVDIDRSTSRLIYRAKVFSTTVGFRTRVEVKLKPDGAIYVSILGVPVELPFIVLMKALGVEKDSEIADMVSLDPAIREQLEPSFDKSPRIDSVEKAIVFIGNKVAYGQEEARRIQRANSILDNNLFLHLGTTPEARLTKARYLAEIACRLIELKLGLRAEDDKDHYANKRIRLSGPLLGDLFRTIFRDMIKDMSYQLERLSAKKLVNESIKLAIRPGILTERMQHAIATGNWGRNRVGVSQLVDRTNILSTLSHLRRLQSPLSRSQPNFEARELHSTHFGRLCPVETPEGSNCGLVKNLAFMATISVSADTNHVCKVLKDLGCIPVENADRETRIRGVKVYVNGTLSFYTLKPEKLVKDFIRYRRKGRVSTEVNIAYLKAKNEVQVNCDAGRCRRPLIVVENGSPLLKQEHLNALKKGLLKWDDLVKMGIIEYLDAEEEENAYIALRPEDIKPETTHLEIYPFTILGICGSIIPFAEHNHSPRNSYEAAMAKQAIGVYAINYFLRMDPRAHFLHYPQRPLVETKSMEVMGFHKRPTGQNMVVAILTMSGYNMEDAIIFNKYSIERGLARSSFFQLYEAECYQYMGGEKDKIEIPSSGMRGYMGDEYYRVLEEDGIASVESEVQGGDVLIGRTSPPRFIEEYRELEAKGPSRRDTSVTLKPSTKGIVDTVIVTENSQGNKVVKVKVRSNRIPEIGDKFASRHGQKGVIGMIYPSEDMPFTEDGIVPDVIINPHAFPSRMTVGQLLESLFGKAAALMGRPVDGTAFQEEKIEDIEAVLKRYGFEPTGKEVMYNGLTGEKLEAKVYIGVVYYQRLHHMVADKIHARARGLVQMLTRQPTEGRARGGGLRFGEMERDCLIGYGAAMLIKDRMLEESDKFTAYVCAKCGLLAYYDSKTNRYVCRVCGDSARIYPVVMPYAFKLLLQELMSMCIAPRIIVEEGI
jgi:DNA-directed RNA polymerase subunit B